MAEIYKDQVYAPYLQGKKDLTILDVGGNVGITAYYFSQFAKIVHVLEPAKEHFEILKQMRDFNGLTNVKLHNVALSNEDGEAPFYHLQNKTMYSLTPAQMTNDIEKVKTVRLDTFLKDIPHVDFMKSDTEGNEYEIFCGDAFANVAYKIDTIIIEVHSWAGRNPNQLREAFKYNGFEFEQIPNDATIIIAKRK